MAYTAPHTIVSGELVSVATMNNEWGGNAAFLANPPACRVYHNAAQSIAHASFANLAFNSERYDTDSMHSTSVNTGRITINTAGLYLLTFTGQYTAGTDYSTVAAGFWLNGTTFLNLQNHGSITNATVAAAVTLSTVYKLAVTNYVEVRVAHSNAAAAARNMESSGNSSPEFSATWIGLG